MSTKDLKTEELIKETAKRIFFTEGKLHATTQDIADAAGVNRALLHYYFRSRDILFDIVFKEAIEQMHCKMEVVMADGVDLKDRIRKLIHNFTEMSLQYPFLEAFVITEMIRNPDKRKEFKPDMMEQTEKIQAFYNELEQAMNSGQMAKVSPVDFLINLISLMAYPILARPMLQDLFKMDDNQWNQYIEQRAKNLPDLIFNLPSKA